MNRQTEQRILAKARAYDSLLAIFSLMLAHSDSATKEAAERIRQLDAIGRRDLRAAIQSLDYLMNDVFLAERCEKRRGKLL